MFDKPLVIFDCDGVLIDSEVIYLDEEYSFLAARGISLDKPAYQAEFMALAQPLWKAKFSQLIEDHTGSPLSDAEYDAMKTAIRARILNELQPVVGVDDMLAALTTPICVASTTSMKYLPRKLKQAELTNFFGDGVYSGDMVENCKPAPDLFLHAAQQMRSAPDNCIVVEDSVNGVKGGKAAKMFTIGFTGGSHCLEGYAATLENAGADIVLPSHAALNNWLQENTNAAR